LPVSIGDLPRQERHQVVRPDPDRIDDPDVGQLTSFTQPINSRGADPQLFGYVSHPQHSIAPTVQRD
jgi:hypothetical protein